VLFVCFVDERIAFIRRPTQDSESPDIIGGG
jgi:hypothetical protein